MEEQKIEYIYNLALLYKEAEDYDKALRTIKKIENSIGVNERIIYIKHDLYSRLKRRKEAIMPRGDGTGPAGMGPMTGRAAGYCAGYPVAGYMNPSGGRLGMGFGWGRGRGRGYSWRRQLVPYGGGVPYGAPYDSYYTEEKELDLLQNQGKFLQEQLNDVNKRISELEVQEKKKEK